MSASYGVWPATRDSENGEAIEPHVIRQGPHIGWPVDDATVVLKCRQAKARAVGGYDSDVSLAGHPID
jgi:hypothetical protein